MKSSLAYAIAFVAFSVAVFGFVFWKVYKTDYTLKNVKVKIQLSAIVADELALHYSNNTAFDNQKKLSFPVSGSSKVETLNFDLPGDNNNFILLRLSTNPSQEKISIHNISLESDDKIKTYKGSQIKEFFRSNQFIKTAFVKKDKVDYTLKKIGEKYDPVLGPVYLQQILY